MMLRRLCGPSACYNDGAECVSGPTNGLEAVRPEPHPAGHIFELLADVIRQLKFQNPSVLPILLEERHSGD